MQKLKINCKTEKEKKEAIKLLIELGNNNFDTTDKYLKLVVHGDGDIQSIIDSEFNYEYEDYKKITLQELRDMVNAKQKEYIVKTDTGYTLQVLSNVVDGHDGIIEVPRGSNFATITTDGEVLFFDGSSLEPKHFKKHAVIWQRESLNDQVVSAEQARQEQAQVRELSECDLVDSGKLIIGGLGESFPVGLEHHKFTQPEELPFVDNELKCVDATLAEREAQYGSFIGVANTTGQLMSVLLNSKNGQTLPYAHQEALHMICSKMARIVNGDHNHLDSWHDIGGYAKLIENNIK